MSTQGFHWEGLFRSLQGDLMILIGAIVALLVIGLIASWLMKRAAEAGSVNEEEILDFRKWRKKIFVFLAIVFLFMFGWRVFELIMANRIPRSDVEKSDVYDRMNFNINRETERR